MKLLEEAEVLRVKWTTRVYQVHLKSILVIAKVKHLLRLVVVYASRILIVFENSRFEARKKRLCQLHSDNLRFLYVLQDEAKLLQDVHVNVGA